MWMPVGTQRDIATRSPAIIYMQYAWYSKNSFRFAASTLWNSLPDHFRTENSFYQFKSLLQSWNGSKCCCSACSSPRFLCRLTALIKLLVAVQRQRVLYTETIEFALDPIIPPFDFHFRIYTRDLAILTE